MVLDKLAYMYLAIGFHRMQMYEKQFQVFSRKQSFEYKMNRNLKISHARVTPTGGIAIHGIPSI